MSRILGIDPGSRITGFGVIERGSAGRHRYLASGCIRLDGSDVVDRLSLLFRRMTEVMDEYRPDEVGIEKVFVNRNVDSALKLGQARGVVLCVAGLRQLRVAEYAPRFVKQTVVGTGAATKTQVQHMVTTLLGLSGTPQADAADALAVAVCHANTQRLAERLSG
ncbi:MAG: crossover junction endodeoxyribonuclease RuvC [Pseudomonadota bacterium]|nr:crossover junction endodeoxyribonuclease RuvC [Pseudomonadota bacterium]